MHEISWETVLNWLRVAWNTFLQIARHHKIAAVLIVLFILGGALLILDSWEQAERAQTVLRETLDSEFEPRRQDYMGLEAFFLSIPALAKFQNNIKTSRLSHDFSTAVETFDQHFREQYDKFRSSPPKVSSLPLDLRVERKMKRGIIILSDASSDGYLFLPSGLLRFSLSDQQENQLHEGTPVKQYTFLSDALEKDQPLLTDIAVSQQVGTDLRQLINTSIWDEGYAPSSVKVTPIQAFLISRNGVLRIVNSMAGDLHTYYRDHFRPDFFFPTSPYYSGAVEHYRTNKPTVDSQFYVSKPYLDLGGFGTVVTLSYAIPDEPGFVVGFDVQVIDSKVLAQQLAERVAELDGVSVIVECGEGSSPTCSIVSGRQDQDVLRLDLQHSFETDARHAEISQIAGTIRVVGQPDPKGALEVSVPLSSPTTASQKYRFFAASFNLAASLKRRLWESFAGFLLVGSAILLLTMVTIDILRNKTEVEEAKAEVHNALERVAKMMASAQTPYVRLDSDDHIVDANPALASLLGLGSNPERLRGVIFGTLCWDQPSRDKYESVERDRVAGREVRPYEINLSFEGSPVRRVMIHSAAVPPRNVGTLPETFGILVLSKLSPET
jgi:PAS domain-containing protein